MTRLAFFSVVDFLTGLGNICPAFNFVHDEKLQSPNNVSGIFNTARLFETLEGNGLIVVGTVEGTDDDESGIGVALEFFKFANSVVNAEFDVVLVMRNDLKVVKADDRSFFRLNTERTNTVEQVVNGFVLKFDDLKIEFRISDFCNDRIERVRPSPASNIGGSEGRLFVIDEEIS